MNEATTASYILAYSLLIFLALVGCYDVWAFHRWGWDGTVTHVFRSWSATNPALPFLAGCLAGHLFL